MAEGAARTRHSGSERGHAEVIDLTGEDLAVIDLTEGEGSPEVGAECALPPHGPLLPAVKQESKEEAEQGCGAPWDRAHAETKGTHGGGCFSSDSSSSSTTINSDLGSLASLQLDSDVFSFSSASSWRAGSDCSVPEPPSSCQPRDDPDCGPLPPAQRLSPDRSSCPPASGRGSPEWPLLETSRWVLGAAKQEPPEPGRRRLVHKAWLHKLRYFRRMPVHHLFLQGVVQDEETRQNARRKAQPIPSTKLSMVVTTMEENFPRGTLQFLTDFVSCQHYPPKEIVSHVTRNILLSSEAGPLLKDAYMLLMKIQMLHPATTAVLGWDWDLLRYVLEEQEEKLPGRVLFLQYVVQTLEDDFQLNLRLRCLQKSIAKKVLSCDRCFSNVKEVIEWLVAAVTGLRFSPLQEQQHEASCPSPDSSRAGSHAPFPGPDSAEDDDEAGGSEAALPASLAQKEVLLLQRMLAVAVEVDMSPNCSTNKMAEVVFPYVVNIPLRSQREAFLNSMESPLLRCKVLELLFHHSCDVPAALQLSLPKTLYFLGHSSLLLQYQDEEVTWQRWEEMLQHLNLLLLSYHHVVLGHLRSSLSERMDLIIANAKPKVQESDRLMPTDVEMHIQDFSSRLQQVLGQPLPPQLKDKVCVLRELLLATTA
ncbi:SUMO-interacting motif-containing protein 1 [Pelodiscus sinensis]|uniref:SUMO-interacting motif-containing protein 1 n=1 Tax=Pelodiscus sinensis TaxID=13735 RepID=UPI003F6D81EF